VTPRSVAASWTPGASHNCQIFQDSGDNACIKSFPARPLAKFPVRPREQQYHCASPVAMPRTRHQGAVSGLYLTLPAYADPGPGDGLNDGLFEKHLPRQVDQTARR
jgi:hypothetical protein